MSNGLLGRRRRLLVIPVVTVLVAVMFSACQPAVTMLSGTVGDGHGDGVTGVTVRVYAVGASTPTATAVTGDDGTYRFDSSVLAAGTYNVRFGDSDWYDGATEPSAATPVTVSEAAPAVANDTYSEDSGAISGSVTDADSGDPISGADVQVLDARGSVQVDTSTSDDGTWSSGDLNPGPYTVRFSSGGYATLYNGGAITAAAAAPIEVAPDASVTGVDVALPGSASIQVDLDTAPPPDGSTLFGVVADAATGHFVTFAALGGGGEEGPGNVVDGIPPGTYRFEVLDTSGSLMPWVYGTTSTNLTDGATITLAAGGQFEATGLTYHARSCTALAPHPDLAGVDLSGRTYLGCDLSGANLAGANLTGTNLSGANLTGANLSGAVLSAATDLSRATITGANVVGTDLSPLSLVSGIVSGALVGPPSALPAGARVVDGYLVASGVSLAGAQLGGADLVGATMDGVDLTGARLVNADLRGADLSQSTALGADLTGANLASDGTASANFFYADLTSAVLDGVTVDAGTSFDRANLTGTSWTGTSLTALPSGSSGGLAFVTTGGIAAPPSTLPSGFMFATGFFVGPYQDISHADLQGVNFAGVSLTGSSIWSSNFAGANMSGLNLSAVSITGSNLANADFSNVWITNSTVLSGDRFTGANLSGTNLAPLKAYNFYTVSSGAITNGPAALPSGWSLLSGWIIGPYADLSNADFSGVDLTGVDLSTTNVDGAKFATADMTGVKSASVTGTPASLPTGWFVADSHVNSERYLAGPYANVTGAVFSEIDMSDTDLHGANLTGASFLYGTNVQGMDLSGATLTGVRSNITGAPGALPVGWVVRADAQSANHLLGPGAYVYGDYSQLDFTGVNLSNLNLSGATLLSTNLTNTNLSGTNLSGASVSHLSLQGADLSGANLTGVNFSTSTGTPNGGATAVYSGTTCPDGVSVSAPYTCVGHGFAG